MKQLVLDDDTPSQIFFNDYTPFDDIFEWVQQMAMFDKKNIFNLNEQHSCSVEPNMRDNTFTISGDEDYRELSLETITPIT